MKLGIAPALLLEQVKGTAAWLWTDERTAATARVLDAGAGTAGEEAYRGKDRVAYLELLLSAHYATVATFVPTDVDARIRHHAWTELASGDALEEACAIVQEVASWPADAVSARVVAGISGHDGEWLAVRAGAIARAAALGHEKLVDQLTDQIDAELARSEALFGERRAPRATLEIATVIAHNTGDLSRVVAAWPRGDARAEQLLAPLRERWSRLGHPDAPAPRPALVAAGALNKALMAQENPRWLALRKSRALRGSRDLLLPIGPWLDEWGERVATHPALEAGDRAEVLAALLDHHGRAPAQEGCLRAIAGLHRATRGGLELYVPDLPARMRKDALRGRVRDALDVTPAHFAARIERKYENLRAGPSPA